MQVRLLGPIQVVTAGQAHPVPGLRRQGILALLALHHREIVSTDRLVETVWPDAAAVAPNSLQSHVSHLRRLLNCRTAILARGPGYVLDVGTDGVDVAVAERLVDQGLRGVDPAQRARSLESALRLWRGRPLAELAELSWTTDHVTRLDQLRLTARRALAQARSELGEHASAVPELRQLCREQPFDEMVHRQLMLALWRTGRPAEALAVFRGLRRTLRDELGIDPGEELRQLESAILRHDPLPGTPARATPPPAEPPPAEPRATRPIEPRATPLAEGARPARPSQPARAVDPVEPPLGRATECARLAELLDRARTGHGRAVVLRGEAGIGKTTLLNHLATTTDFQVVRALGVEFESELALSALTELIGPLAGYLPALPEAYAQTLRNLGVVGPASPAGPATDRHTVYAATLALLTTAAADRPVLCLIDDAQWLDRASAEALLFTARRLLADAVLMVFAARDASDFTGEPGFPAPGVEELPVTGLDEAACTTLLARHHLATPLAGVRLAELTQGNPLALVELARVLTVTGGAADPTTIAAAAGPIPTTRRLDSVFAAEVRSLTGPDRLALLVCAAAGTGELSALTRALAATGLEPSAWDSAVAAGLVRITADAVTFRHPLTRSAVYAQAGPGQRRRAHLALAEAYAAPADTDRRAWHLAHAALGPDDQVADVLADTAARARARGGVVAEAAALERSATLTADPTRRAIRLEAAATAWVRAGSVDHGQTLLDQAAALPQLSAPARLAVLGTRGYVAMLRGDAVGIFDDLIAATADVAPEHRLAAGLTLSLAMNPPARRWDVAGMLDVCTRALRLVAPDGPNAEFPKMAVRLAYAQVLAGLAEGSELARRGITLCGQREPHGAGAELAEVLTWIEEYAAAQRLVDYDVDGARAIGDLALLIYALQRRAPLLQRMGRLSAGYADAIDAVLLAELMGQPSTIASALAAQALLEATLGRPDECRAHAAEAIRRCPDHLLIRAQAEYALGYSALAGGDHSVAVEHLDRARQLVHARGVVEPAAVPATADLAEAQARSGDAAAARVTLRRLDRMVERTGRRGQRAAALRVRALLAPDRAAAALFRAALAEHTGVGAPLEEARTRLAYGDWLVRIGQAEAAGRELSAAAQVFRRAGARPWAGRAADGLDRLGRRPPAAPDHAAELSGMPWRIAWAVAQGQSPREIAPQVLLSVRTVEFHLTAALRTLGLRTAAELADRFGAAAGLDPGAGPAQLQASTATTLDFSRSR